MCGRGEGMGAGVVTGQGREGGLRRRGQEGGKEKRLIRGVCVVWGVRDLTGTC